MMIMSNFFDSKPECDGQTEGRMDVRTGKQGFPYQCRPSVCRRATKAAKSKRPCYKGLLLENQWVHGRLKRGVYPNFYSGWLHCIATVPYIPYSIKGQGFSAP